MNLFQIFDQQNNLKDVLTGDFISVCIDDTPVEIFVKYENNNLILVLHINGEVLKEEIIPIKQVYG